MNFIDFTNFTKVNEATDPEKLSPSELTILENMRLDSPIGVPSTRRGFSHYNYAVDSSGDINNIYDVVNSAGTNYLLASIGDKLKKSTAGTGAYSSIKTGLTTGCKLRMANYGDKFLFTNGVDQPFYTDLLTASNMAIVPPVMFGVYLAPHTPNIGAQKWIYRYILVYVTAHGQKSNASLPIQIDNTYSIDSTNYVDLEYLPVSSDPNVTSRRLYRTKANGFIEYYLVTELDNTTNVYTDSTPDTQLDTTESVVYYNTPDTAKYICEKSERIFLANIKKTNANRILPMPTIGINFLDSYSVSVGSGNIGAGNYYYAYSLVDTVDNESALSIFQEHNFATGSANIVFQGFPLPIISYIYNEPWDVSILYDPTIKFVRFYRTKAGGAATGPFYFIGDSLVQGALYPSQYFTDDKADASLTIPYPESTHNALEQSLLSYAIVYSDLYEPHNFPELNYIEIYPEDRDDITGIFDDDNGTTIFKRKSICKLYTNGDPSNWEVHKIVENIGCDQPDTIFRYGTSYFFVFKNKCYTLEGSSVKLISYDRKTTFDAITTFYGCTFWDNSQWYVLAVAVSTTYYLLCYDTKLQTWYKFTIDKATTLAQKEFGADTGKLLIGSSSQFIAYYNESAYIDTLITGTNIAITTQLETKTYTFPDDFSNARLLYFNYNYLRYTNPLNNTLDIKIKDKLLNTFTKFQDTASDGATEANFRIPIGGMVRLKKLSLNITGDRMLKFYNAKLEYNIEDWNVIRKATAVWSNS